MKPRLDPAELAWHLEQQRRVAEALSAKWKCTWKSLGDYNPIDVHLLRKDEIKAVVEIRARNLWMRDTRLIFMDLDKWFPLMQAEMVLGLKAFYVVGARDGVWAVRVGSLPVREFRIVMRGRRDRPHMKNDVSPVLELPAGEFWHVCEWDGGWPDESSDEAPPLSSEEIPW